MKSGTNTSHSSSLTQYSFVEVLRMVEKGDENTLVFDIVDSVSVDFLNQSTEGGGLTNNLLVQALIVGNKPLYERLIQRGALYPELLYAKSSIGGLENPEDRWHGLTQEQKFERLCTIQWMLAIIYNDFENNIDELNKINLLWFAVFFRAIHVVRGLCELGVHLELTAFRSSLPLDLALSSIATLEIADYLMTKGADIFKTAALTHYVNHGMNDKAVSLLKRFYALYQNDISLQVPTNSKVFSALKTAIQPLNLNEYKRLELIRLTAKMLPREDLETLLTHLEYNMNNEIKQIILLAHASAKKHSFLIQLLESDDEESELSSEELQKLMATPQSIFKRMTVKPKECLLALKSAINNHLFTALATIYFREYLRKDIDAILASLQLDDDDNDSCLVKAAIDEQINLAPKQWWSTPLTPAQVASYIELFQSLKLNNMNDLFPSCNFRRFDPYHLLYHAFEYARVNIPDPTRVATFLVGLRYIGGDLKLHRNLRGMPSQQTTNPDFKRMINLLENHIILETFKLCIHSELFPFMVLQLGKALLNTWLERTVALLSNQHNIHLGSTTLETISTQIRVSPERNTLTTLFFSNPSKPSAEQIDSHAQLKERFSELTISCDVPNITLS